MTAKPKKMRVFKEDGKNRQVTHWDLDYLSKEDLQDLYARRSARRRPSRIEGPDRSGPRLGLILISAGVVLLAGSLFMVSLL